MKPQLLQQLDFAFASALDALTPPRNAEEAHAVTLCANARAALVEANRATEQLPLAALRRHVPATDNEKQQAYLDWRNDFLTVARFAEHYGWSEGFASSIIEEGREVHAKRTAWHVVAVSSNAGSFGHKGVLVLRESGEGLELTLQAYGSTPLPKRGDVLWELPTAEVQPHKLPPCSPEQARKTIAELYPTSIKNMKKKARIICQLVPSLNKPGRYEIAIQHCAGGAISTIEKDGGEGYTGEEAVEVCNKYTTDHTN